MEQDIARRQELLADRDPSGAASGAANRAKKLLTPSVDPGHPANGIRWLTGWIEVVLAAPTVDGRQVRVALATRRATYAITVTGVLFAAGTPARAQVTPFWLQLLVACAISTFASVGFWMLRWPESRTKAVGSIFCVGGAIGSLAYMLATYANWSFERNLPGGVVAGWTSDLLFLPTVAILAPLLLACIPTGHWGERRSFIRATACGALAAVCILVGVLYEPRLISYPGHEVDAPLAHSSVAQISNLSIWEWSLWGGFALLGLAILLGFKAARSERTIKNALHWYNYGGLFALCALAPYVVAAVGLWHFHHGADLARAGVVALATVALVAVPATVDTQWSRARTKRLVRAAIIAAIAAAVHELMVHIAVEHVGGRTGGSDLGVQAIVSYELVLVLFAVLLEPIVWGSERIVESQVWRPAPDSLLDEALDDLHHCQYRLSRAIKRAERLGQLRGDAHPGFNLHSLIPSHIAAKRVLNRWPVSQPEVEVLLGGMRAEYDKADELIDKTTEQLRTLDP